MWLINVFAGGGGIQPADCVVMSGMPTKCPHYSSYVIPKMPLLISKLVEWKLNR